MTRRVREVETLVLAMFAAVPLYLTHAIGIVPLVLFHVVMAGILLRVAVGKSPALIPAVVMRVLAMAYVVFYVVDWRLLSHSAIAASTHLVLFIAAYQPIEAMSRNNQAQRLLTAALIFVASIATSTHITIVVFVIAFAFLMFRQLMYVSHLDTVRSIDHPYAETSSGRAALFYLAGATLIGAVLFPLLPRVRNPFVQGLAGSLPGASSALSESIDFREPRVTTPDTTVVARIWMDQQARPFFAPVRLRGNIYDHFEDGEWKQSFRGLREPASSNGVYTLARRGGLERRATMQQRPQRGKLFLPVGTYAVSGVPNLYEGPVRDTYYSYSGAMMNMDLWLSYQPEPLRLTRVGMSGHPISPQVAALARSIVGDETDPARQAARIESYFVANFRYVANPTTATRPMSLEQFLLRERAGQCEYFAAGMVVLLNSLDVPARIAGGFYGGRLNPLTGYFTIRREDAHAWTEVWDGRRWLTFDGTPASLRPGTQAASALRTLASALSDSVTYFWDRYILTFGLTDQITLFEDLIAWGRSGAATLRGNIAQQLRSLADRDYLAVLASVLAVGLALIFVSRRRRPLFDVLAGALAREGIEVGPAMTMEEALLLLREQQPDAARHLALLVTMYEEEEFSGRPDRARRRELTRRLAEL
jgi:transglutaminase-like putative cysteine protease